MGLRAMGVAQAQPRETGGTLTDPAGFTLYVFGNDLMVPGKSVCINACALSWVRMATRSPTACAAPGTCPSPERVQATRRSAAACGRSAPNKFFGSARSGISDTVVPMPCAMATACMKRSAE